jgi:EmrB/QacA subfamily drug resistance transporter
VLTELVAAAGDQHIRVVAKSGLLRRPMRLSGRASPKSAESLVAVSVSRRSRSAARLSGMSMLHRITVDQLHERRWELLAVTSVGAFMSPLDGNIVAVALPAMGRGLAMSVGPLIWVQAAYLLAMAVLLIPLGRLADHRGRVRYYLLGIVVFTVGSMLAGVSMNGGWLIGSRVVQGAGAALLSATSAAIVTAVFPPQERGRALGINVMAVYLGLSIGPPLGGLLVEIFGWRSVFFVNLPIGLVVLIWGWLLMPRHERSAGAVPRSDVGGAALLGAFLIGLLMPLTFAPEWGWAAPQSIVLLGLAGASLVGFVVRELRVADPVLDLDLVLQNRLFAAANVAALLNYMALYAITYLTSIYLQQVSGRSAGLTGLLLLIQPLIMAVLSPFAGRLSDRVGSRVLTSGGMVAVAVGMTILATLRATSGLGHVLVALTVVGLGMAAFSAPNTSAIMGSVRSDQLGVASGFLGTMRVTGMALSLAVLGGIAAGRLGSLGTDLLMSHGHGAQAAILAARAAREYAVGYRYAMITGAALALVGAAVSLTRGARAEEQA